MVFNATFNNISVLLVEKTRVPGEHHWPAASNWQTLLHIIKFCFSLIGLNSTFLVVPQSEFTSRDPQGVYSRFQRCPTRDEISFPVG